MDYQSSLSWNILLAHQGLEISGSVEKHSHLIRRLDESKVDYHHIYSILVLCVLVKL